MALLLVLLCVAAVVLPLMGLLFKPPSEGIGLSAAQYPIYVKSDADRAVDGVGFVPGEVLVKFVHGAGESEIAGLRVGQGAEEASMSPFSGVRIWRVPASKSVDGWVEFFGRHPLVEYAEPNFVRYASSYPNDPLYVYQWHFDDDHTRNAGGATANPFGGVNGGGIGMEQVWSALNGSFSIIVAVVDTGIAYEDYPIPPSEEKTVKRGSKSMFPKPITMPMTLGVCVKYRFVTVPWDTSGWKATTK